MNKLTSVTFSVAALVIIFMLVSFLRIYIHDLDVTGSCLKDAATCHIAK